MGGQVDQAWLKVATIGLRLHKTAVSHCFQCLTNLIGLHPVWSFGLFGQCRRLFNPLFCVLTSSGCHNAGSGRAQARADLPASLAGEWDMWTRRHSEKASLIT